LLKILHTIIYRSEQLKYISDDGFDKILNNKYSDLFNTYFKNNNGLYKIIFDDRKIVNNHIVCNHKLRHQVFTYYRQKYLFFNYSTDYKLNTEDLNVCVIDNKMSDKVNINKVFTTYIPKRDKLTINLRKILKKKYKKYQRRICHQKYEKYE